MRSLAQASNKLAVPRVRPQLICGAPMALRVLVRHTMQYVFGRQFCARLMTTPPSNQTRQRRPAGIRGMGGRCSVGVPQGITGAHTRQQCGLCCVASCPARSGATRLRHTQYCPACHAPGRHVGDICSRMWEPWSWVCSFCTEEGAAPYVVAACSAPDCKQVVALRCACVHVGHRRGCS